MTDSFLPDDNPDDVSYEDFDDILWDEADGLEVIDLDALDEDVPEERDPEHAAISLNDATSDLLDSLDDAIPPSAPTAAPPIDRLPLPAATDLEATPDTLDDALVADEASTGKTPPTGAAETRRDTLEDAPIEFIAQDPVYQVLIGLPPDLGVQVLKLRETGGIEDMPPPGIILTPRFRTTDRAALVAAINAWVRRDLPLRLEITAVHAEVVGSQRYIAAWRIQPEATLRQRLAHLKQALTGQITPVPEAPASVHLRITLGDSVPASHFPRMVAQMQRDFEPYVWHARTVLLAAYDAAEETPEWHVAAVLDGSPLPDETRPQPPREESQTDR